MSNQLSQKEQNLLKDQLTHEQVCINKYQQYANEASDQKLKEIFQSYAQQEQTHYNTISQILNGQATGQNSLGASSQQNQTTSSSLFSSSGSHAAAIGQATKTNTTASTNQAFAGAGSQMNNPSSLASQSSMSNQASTSGQSSLGSQSAKANQASMSSGSNKDQTICTDMLMTEKYVSGAYDTAIFEFSDANVRQTLNHIQKEEQQHGEGIFNYMQSNGMYNVQG